MAANENLISKSLTSTDETLHYSYTSIIIRPHPCSPNLPYAFDPAVTGLHCYTFPLSGIYHSYQTVLQLVHVMHSLGMMNAIRREQQIFHIAHRNSKHSGFVYDIPTVKGWAAFQKIAHVDACMASLLNSSFFTFRIPKFLVSSDDIKPDKDALPEVIPYTELASILYEALDCLITSIPQSQTDLHLRNLYPHSIWTSGRILSQEQIRKLAAVAPPPRTFLRTVESPIVGEVFAVPHLVRRHGWITFFEAFVPSPLEGGISCDVPRKKRFLPRTWKKQKPAPASFLLEDLTFPELYYLVRIEEVASDEDILAVYYHDFRHDDMNLGLINQEFADKLAFCEALGVKVEYEEGELDTYLDSLANESWHNNRALALAEQIMCDYQTDSESDVSLTDEGFQIVYKRDARLDFATLDGYDGWSDEELSIKKYKAWVVYEPNPLLPAEIAALYASEGIRLYSYNNRLRILRCTDNSLSDSVDGSTDIEVENGLLWTELRCILQSIGKGLTHEADRLILSLLVAGQVCFTGYYACIDSSQWRHRTRFSYVFMDAPLQVLGFLIEGRKLSFDDDVKPSLLIPVSPACTILMRSITERYSVVYGQVFHSDRVSVLPFGCRLGDRSQLKWYAVGAGSFTSSDHPPETLLALTERQLETLSCTATAERDHIVICAQKGVPSVRLRDIGFEAGWSGLSPHLLITGKGKRITTSIRTYSVTQLVDVLRRIRNKSKKELSHSIQEIASMIIMAQVLTGGLYLTRCTSRLQWAPEWKTSDQAFFVAHAISLPRGVGVKVVDSASEKFGILISSDTMIIFQDSGEQNGVQNFCFVGIDASIESEKLLVGPEYEGFVYELCSGSMGID